MSDVLNPTPAMLVKLGSIVVHADEMLSPTGHAFDRVALTTLLADAEVRAWLAEMEVRALIPLRR